MKKRERDSSFDNGKGFPATLSASPIPKFEVVDGIREGSGSGKRDGKERRLKPDGMTG